MLFVGDIPDCMQVLHKCDVRACCNPDHIYLGNHKDNMLDRSVRERTGLSKLTTSDVIEIRQKRINGDPIKKLASLYGVTFQAISRICTRRTWNHVK